MTFNTTKVIRRVRKERKEEKKKEMEEGKEKKKETAGKGEHVNISIALNDNIEGLTRFLLGREIQI